MNKTISTQNKYDFDGRWKHTDCEQSSRKALELHKSITLADLPRWQWPFLLVYVLVWPQICAIIGPLLLIPLLLVCALPCLLPLVLIGVPITMLLNSLGLPEEISGMLAIIPTMLIIAFGLHWLQPFFTRCKRAIRAFRRQPMPGHWKAAGEYGERNQWVED
jgi:hypothetical protein